MKIIIIGPLPNPINGCSLANQTFLKHAVLSGHQVEAINTSVKSIHGNQGSFSWVKAFNFIKVYFSLFKLFFSDVVYMTPGQSFFGVVKYAPFILLSILLNKPYIIHVHGNYLGTQYRSLKGVRKIVFKFLLSHASAGIVLSESLRANFKEILPSERIFVVENFADDELINAEFKLKNSTNMYILWLSNLMIEKGIFEFLDALQILKNKNIKFKANIAGNIEEGIEEKIYKKLKDLGSDVEYIGVVKGQEKKDILFNSNVFVFPTYYTMEGQPIALIEAMASGNIIVTTKHAGIPDIIDSSNGYLVQPKNVIVLAEILENISKNLDNEIDKFSVHNQIYAKQRFTEKVFAEKILQVLESVQK